MKTQLKDRILWWDGTSEVTQDQAISLILSGVPLEKIVCADVGNFNDYSDVQIQTSKFENLPFDFSWKVPSVDVKSLLFNKCPKEYLSRLELELQLFEERNLIPFLQALHFVVETFKKNNIVWGVGRGSSCASLVLFLLGVHLVDPIKYEIPIEEFFHI